VKTVDQLVDLYFTSVGRNSKLLLNVPPTRAGLLHETDVARLGAFRRSVDDLLSEARDVTRGHEVRPRPSAGAPRVFDVDLGGGREVSIADLREPITNGQVVSHYTLSGALDSGLKTWKVLSHGTTIGYRKLDRFAATPLYALRLAVQTVAPLAGPLTVRAFSPA